LGGDAMTRRLTLFAVLVVVVLTVMTGCGEAYQKYSELNYVPSAVELTHIADEWPDDDPLKATAQAVALERFATAQAAQSQVEQLQLTSQAVEQQRQAAQDAAQRQYTMLTAEAQMTQEVHQRTIEAQYVWATQQAANATQVAQATAMAMAVQATTEARYAQATATERAYQATATRQAQNDTAMATQQALNQQATATRGAWEARTTATAESWQATRQAEHVVLTRQAEKREETLGYVRDYGIPVVLVVLAGCIGALVVYGVRQVASRPIVYPRNFLGDAEPMAIPGQDGGYTFVDLDRQPGPAIRVLPSGQVEAPLLRSTGQEERTTARDQLVGRGDSSKVGLRRSKDRTANAIRSGPAKSACARFAQCADAQAT
jgi:hypothetical protein